MTSDRYIIYFFGGGGVTSLRFLCPGTENSLVYSFLPVCLAQNYNLGHIFYTLMELFCLVCILPVSLKFWNIDLYPSSIFTNTPCFVLFLR